MVQKVEAISKLTSYNGSNQQEGKINPFFDYCFYFPFFFFIIFSISVFYYFENQVFSNQLIKSRVNTNGLGKIQDQELFLNIE